MSSPEQQTWSSANIAIACNISLGGKMHNNPLVQKGSIINVDLTAIEETIALYNPEWNNSLLFEVTDIESIQTNTNGGRVGLSGLSETLDDGTQRVQIVLFGGLSAVEQYAKSKPNSKLVKKARARANSLLKDDTELEKLSQKGKLSKQQAASIMLNATSFIPAEAVDVQKSAVHELVHIADDNNHDIIKSYYKHIRNFRLRLIATLYGSIAMSEIVVLSVNSYLLDNKINQLVVVAIGAAAGFGLFARTGDKIGKLGRIHAYNNNPFEERAFDAEEQAHTLPTIISITHK